MYILSSIFQIKYIYEFHILYLKEVTIVDDIIVHIKSKYVRIIKVSTSRVCIRICILQNLKKRFKKYQFPNKCTGQHD